MLSFGIEEEFVLLHRSSLSPINAATIVRRALLSAGVDSSVVHQEFFESQLEFTSPVFTDLAVAAGQLNHFRTALSLAAGAEGVLAAGIGTPFDVDGEPVSSSGARYAAVAANVRALTVEHQINGLHVHVGISSRQAGVQVLNDVRRWLPSLLALSANSPYWRGTDTGYGSWRAIHSRRWTTAGCPPVFADSNDYDQRIDALTGIGATIDTGTISWYARLSERHPTLEFRVADAQLDAGTSLLIAALCRALVATSLRAPTARQQPNTELLDAALWHAARDGLTGSLVHPLTGRLVPAATALTALLDEVREELLNTGDLPTVEKLLNEIWVRGSGAERQRLALQAGGVPALANLIDTELTRDVGDCHQIPSNPNTTTSIYSGGQP